MTLKDIVQSLGLKVLTGEDQLDSEVNRGYSSDLMSDVIANAKKADLWVTLQVHVNVVAVAVMKELSGIILINGRNPEPETLDRAGYEGIPLFQSELPAFELIGRLYSLGVPGIRNG
jgi:hypothetical protein